ncbi:MAG: aliphatic sulfonate ABC transporter substrate-binding protein [Gluconacetobacter diazotrophicus]|nr:aliphatic sulfonate ABC transporter substrate-binding protein [Gluconacetobacter diazotrophicus]
MTDGIGRRGFLFGAGAAVLAMPAVAWAAGTAVALDYAYYNPLSLVVRDRRLVEKALGAGTTVTWVLSEGSNKALGYLRGGSIGIGSTAGAAALLGRANGAPVQVAGIYAEAEWCALVARKGSAVRDVAGLKGKSVAATPGTDPFIFLVRALKGAGLGVNDIRLVPLQHAQGRLALDRGQVDAWAGLDPFMAEAEIENGDALFFRNRDYVSPGTIVAREELLAKSPEVVKGVLAAYAEAGAWARANPDGVAALLAGAAKLPEAVAKRQLERTRFPSVAVDAAQRARIGAAVPVLAGSGSLSAGADPGRAFATLFAGAAGGSGVTG